MMLLKAGLWEGRTKLRQQVMKWLQDQRWDAEMKLPVWELWNKWFPIPPYWKKNPWCADCMNGVSVGTMPVQACLTKQGTDEPCPFAWVLRVSWEVTRVQSSGLWVWLNTNILVIWSVSHSDSGEARTMTVCQSNGFLVKYLTSFMVTCNSWTNHFNKSRLNADMRAL